MRYLGPSTIEPKEENGRSGPSPQRVPHGPPADPLSASIGRLAARSVASASPPQSRPPISLRFPALGINGLKADSGARHCFEASLQAGDPLCLFNHMRKSFYIRT